MIPVYPQYNPNNIPRGPWSLHPKPQYNPNITLMGPLTSNPKAWLELRLSNLAMQIQSVGLENTGCRLVGLGFRIWGLTAIQMAGICLSTTSGVSRGLAPPLRVVLGFRASLSWALQYLSLTTHITPCPYINYSQDFPRWLMDMGSVLGN